MKVILKTLFSQVTLIQLTFPLICQSKKQIPKPQVSYLARESGWTVLVAKGYLDTYRFIHGQKEGAYSWWTYRNNCRDRNIGWRIDYFFHQ
jgi:exonuclease III